MPSNPGNEARAALYRLLSQAFLYPLDLDWARFSENFLPLLREAAEELGLPVAEALETLQGSWPQRPDEGLLQAYTETFLNAPQGSLAPLNESVHLDERVYSQRTQGVQEIYVRAGFAPSTAHQDLLADHLSLELEFMALSLLRGEEGRAFFLEHVNSWQPGLAQTLTDRCEHPFYRTLGGILKAFLARERRLFLDPKPSHAPGRP